MQQTVPSGNYEIRNERGELASDEAVFTVHGVQWAHIHGQTRPLSEYLDIGYTFTPLVAMTPERVAALEELVSLAEYDLNEGYRRDDALKAAVLTVRALLSEVSDVQS